MNIGFFSKDKCYPLRIALVYATFGLLWITFSDAILARVVFDIDTMAQIQTYKGGLFIALTSGLVFILVNKHALHQAEIEQQLREREQQFKETSRELQTIIDNIPAFIIYKNDQNMILRVNKVAANAAGFNAEAMAGKSAELFYPAQAKQYYQDDLEVIRTGRPKLGVIEEIPTQEGEKRWIESNKIPIRMRDGKVTEILIVASDITERQQAQAVLEQQRALLEAIYNDIPDALMMADLDRMIVLANPGTMRIFGYQPNELIGKSTLTLYATEEEYIRQGTLRFDRNAPEILSPYVVNYRRKNGEIFPGESVGTVIKGPNGQAMGFLGLIRDISDRVESEKESRQLRERLAHVARVGILGEMAAGIAHEINQPLTAIANYAQACRRILDSNPASPKLQKALLQISEQALRAGEVILRLRNFVKQGEGERQQVDCNTLIREVVNLAEMETRINEIPIHLIIEEQLPELSADRIQVQQVILNLIRNAMEALIAAEIHDPKIQIHCRLEHTNRVLLEVIDNGRGIARTQVDNVFTPFFTTKSTGLGMGLSICRTIIKSHGGELNYRPNPSGGSVFYFSLPVVGG